MSPNSQSATVADQRFPWGIAVVVAILLCGGFAARAEGSCGDYLHRNTTVKNNAPIRIDADRADDGHAPRRNCSGPSCRSAPEPPARSIPVEDRASNIERLAMLTTAVLDCIGESARLRPGNSLLELEDHRRDLDRPPRSC